MKRRTLLSWTTAGLAALWAAAGVSVAAMLRFFTPSVFYEPPQEFKIGHPGDFPFGTPTFLPDEKIFVFREEGKGFSVASAVCTHLGCTVQWFNRDDHFHCPCHGSVFAENGHVLHGPAPQPLPWFEVTLAKDGQLRVDKNRVVSASYHLMINA